MSFNNYTFTPRKRRGLSSVVGALLFVVLMVATFAVLGVALNSQTDIVSTGRDVAQIDLEKNLEEFSVGISTGVGEALIVDVDNKGQNPVEISTLIITNSTATPSGFFTEAHDVPSETSFVGPKKQKNVVSTISLNMALPLSGVEVYNIKVISSLGTIKTASLSCQPAPDGCGAVSSGGKLTAQLFLDGPNGVNTKTSTIVMFVTNTDSVTITDVRPTKGFTNPLCDDLLNLVDATGTTENLFVEGISNCNVVPSIPLSPDTIDLVAYQTALFKWDVDVAGDIGAILKFCSDVSGTHPVDGLITSGSESCDSLTIINPNDCDGCGEGGEGGETIILIDDLLIKPSIFMTIPSPFGDSTGGDDEKGLWGVNVANPTDQDMTISKVTIVAFPPGGDAQDVVFDGSKSGGNICLEEDILPLTGPSPGGDWDCPRDNTLMWQNFTNPVLLPANSTKSFMLLVEPGDIFVSGRNLDALIVQANVYSTFGSFGKAGYQSTMYEAESPIVNVYLQDGSADLRSGYIGNVNDIANFTSVSFDAVLADLDDNEFTFINAGAKFIINVPREWTFEGFISCDGFDDVEDGDCDLTDTNFPSVTLHSDGSTQIIGTSTNIIGDGDTDDFTDPSEAKKISFTVTSAPVDFNRLYIMYILADGIVTTPDGDRTIGPLAEVVLNVDP